MFLVLVLLLNAVVSLIMHFVFNFSAAAAMAGWIGGTTAGVIINAFHEINEK